MPFILKSNRNSTKKYWTKNPQFIFNALINPRFWVNRWWSRRNSFFSLKNTFNIQIQVAFCVLVWLLLWPVWAAFPGWQRLLNTNVLLWVALAILESEVCYFSVKQLQQHCRDTNSQCASTLKTTKNRERNRGVFWSCYLSIKLL